jgi:hypothetical protein
MCLPADVYIAHFQQVCFDCRLCVKYLSADCTEDAVVAMGNDRTNGMRAYL